MTTTQEIPTSVVDSLQVGGAGEGAGEGEREESEQGP